MWGCFPLTFFLTFSIHNPFLEREIDGLKPAVSGLLNLLKKNGLFNFLPWSWSPRKRRRAFTFPHSSSLAQQSNQRNAAQDQYQRETCMRDALKKGYDSTRHQVHLNINASSNHCHFTQGDAFVTKISPNLVYLLGFSDEVMIDTNVMGTREVDALSNHLRQLHLLSNVIQTTANGKHQRQILCDFLHMQTTEPIKEKWFDPINYHPVARSDIDMIHLQLTDDAYNPISIKDVNTLVTLYFRKSVKDICITIKIYL